jgi:hypothetical protein
MNGLATAAAVLMAVLLRSLRRFMIMWRPSFCFNKHAARKMPEQTKKSLLLR